MDTMETVLERVTEMEGYLNECTAATADMSALLERVKGLRNQVTALFTYYGSEDWFQDRERKLPKDVPAGVLSEDLVYNQITDLRDTAFQMLELATDILRNWI